MKLFDLSQSLSASKLASFERLARYTTAPSRRPISEKQNKAPVSHTVSGRLAALMPIVATGFPVVIKIIAVLCSLSSPANCHEQTVTTSDFAEVSMQSCLMGAPQLAEWMRQHPAERLAAWRCVIGKQDGRGA